MRCSCEPGLTCSFPCWHVLHDEHHPQPICAPQSLQFECLAHSVSITYPTTTEVVPLYVS